jgi:hypothetical protein
MVFCPACFKKHDSPASNDDQRQQEEPTQTVERLWQAITEDGSFVTTEAFCTNVEHCFLFMNARCSNCGISAIHYVWESNTSFKNVFVAMIFNRFPEEHAGLQAFARTPIKANGATLPLEMFLSDPSYTAGQGVNKDFGRE